MVTTASISADIVLDHCVTGFQENVLPAVKMAGFQFPAMNVSG